MPRSPGPPCVVCGSPSRAKELCGKHYQRWLRHGSTAQTRPETWGQKHKHPLWHSWKWTQRVGRCPEWDDFWRFVKDVGERPTEHHRLHRHDAQKPFGPENWFWRDPTYKPEDDRADAALRQRRWRAKNPLRAKSYDMKRKYGITLGEYEAMLKEQDGKCAICGQIDEWFSLAVDHCHGTSVVRGLLCSQCNRGIGMFKDKPDLLERAADYLRHRKRLI